MRRGRGREAARRTPTSGPLQRIAHLKSEREKTRDGSEVRDNGAILSGLNRTGSQQGKVGEEEE